MQIKKWYSFAEGKLYEGPEPAFFETENKSWTVLLEKNYASIKSELATIIETRDKNIIPYFNKTLANKAESWTIFPLYIWGKKNAGNCNKCPQTTALVESISGMTSCSFSILKPHTTIKPHHGDSNVMYRCHLTLKNESALPQTGMRVKNETKGWEKGRLFAFCDAHEHEVWNNAAEERWVLIIDILREEFEAEKKKICSEVNATLFWQHAFQRFYFIRHLPRWCRRLMIKTTSWFT